MLINKKRYDKSDTTCYIWWPKKFLNANTHEFKNLFVQKEHPLLPSWYNPNVPVIFEPGRGWEAINFIQNEEKTLFKAIKKYIEKLYSNNFLLPIFLRKENGINDWVVVVKSNVYMQFLIPDKYTFQWDMEFYKVSHIGKPPNKYIPLQSFNEETKDTSETKVRRKKADALGEKEFYYQKALEYRFRTYRIRHRKLSDFDITDLCNENILIEIKSSKDLDCAIGQMFRYEDQMEQKGYIEDTKYVQKVIILFGVDKFKKRFEDRSKPFDDRVDSLYKKTGYRLLFAGDPINFLDDYELAMAENQTPNFDFDSDDDVQSEKSEDEDSSLIHRMLTFKPF